MPKFDPRFWEILFPPGEMDNFSEEEAIWHETEEDKLFGKKLEQKGGIRGTSVPRKGNSATKRKMKNVRFTPLIMEIIENDLTEMQRNCIKQHFLCERTWEEVAYSLGISRRVVTQHIYGIHRRGKRVGGGIRKICEERGISL